MPRVGYKMEGDHLTERQQFSPVQYIFIFFSLLPQKHELRNLQITSGTSVSISREWTGFGLKECVPRDRKKEKWREHGLLPRCEEVLE